MTTLELTGLKGHHPLGFLAACGLLRCCNTCCDLAIKLAWKKQSDRHFIAIIHCCTEINIKRLTEIINSHRKQQEKSPALTWKIKTKTKKDNKSDANKNDKEQQKEIGLFRKAAESLLSQVGNSQCYESLAWFAALASDVAADGDDLNFTDFDLTSGQQDLMTSIRELGDKDFTEEQMREALQGPWKYQDQDHSLGWDPNTQRLHALRHKLPAADKQGRSVRAAVFLASQALPLFPCFAVGGKLRTTGFYRENGEDWFSWPIWREPISLDTLKSLLAHPFHHDLRYRGVEVVYRCRRVKTGGSEGNYQIFSYAEERPWPRRRRRALVLRF
jgi:hypothetical protein